MPRAPQVRGRAITLAVLAHVLLILALAFGVNWRSDEPATVAAELWSATP
ncbi:MAG: cell envelope integrity protein TolA, partial [Rhizobiales bacterium]|nr:cell envelope integrity protein TolA [Rhizobacter sp.]